MSATASTDRHGLPAVLDFDKVFVTVFWALSEERDVMLTNIADRACAGYNPDEARLYFDQDIEAALAALGVPQPPGDNPDWKGHLHDLVFKSAPLLEQYFADTTDQE